MTYFGLNLTCKVSYYLFQFIIIKKKKLSSKAYRIYQQKKKKNAITVSFGLLNK